MSNVMDTLLAADAMAAKLGVGCGLNPRLRAAIEQDLRMPARSAGPLPSAETVAEAEAQGCYAKKPRCRRCEDVLRGQLRRLWMRRGCAEAKACYADSYGGRGCAADN